MNGINNMTDNEGLTNPTDYQVDVFIDHLDRNGATLKSYTLRGAFPTSLDDIALSMIRIMLLKLLVYLSHINTLKQILLHNIKQVIRKI